MDAGNLSQETALVMEPPNSLPEHRVTRFLMVVIPLISLAIGCLVPAFIDQVDAQQSETPGFFRVLIVAAVSIMCAACLFVFFVGEKSSLWYDSQISLRVVFGAMTCLGVLSAIFAKEPLVVSVSGFVGSLLAIIGHVAYFPSRRWNVLCLLVCIYGPFLWFVREVDYVSGEFMLLLLGLPAFGPSVMGIGLAGSNLHEMNYVPVFVSALELVVLLYFAHRGGRWLLLALVVALSFSSLGACVLNVLLRV